MLPYAHSHTNTTLIDRAFIKTNHLEVLITQVIIHYLILTRIQPYNTEVTKYIKEIELSRQIYNRLILMFSVV